MSSAWPEKLQISQITPMFSYFNIVIIGETNIYRMYDGVFWIIPEVDGYLKFLDHIAL